MNRDSLKNKFFRETGLLVYDANATDFTYKKYAEWLEKKLIRLSKQKSKNKYIHVKGFPIKISDPRFNLTDGRLVEAK